MIRPAEEEEPAVSSITTTGAISITGSDMLPAKDVEAAVASTAASANFFILFLQVIAHGKFIEV